MNADTSPESLRQFIISMAETTVALDEAVGDWLASPDGKNVVAGARALTEQFVSWLGTDEVQTFLKMARAGRGQGPVVNE